MLPKKTKVGLIFMVILLLLLSVTTTSYAYTKYTVANGDSLFKISLKFNTSMSKLSTLNNLNNPNLIYTNQTLLLPDSNPNYSNGSNSTDYNSGYQRISYNSKTDEQTSSQPEEPAKKMYRRGPKVKKIALTFDDGPDTKYTPRILEILKKYNVKATFFLLGKLAEKHPEVVRKIKADGHIIANHSWSHANLTKLSKAELSQELNDTSKALERITNYKTILLRPPYGAVSDKLLDRLKGTDYEIIHWSVDSLDWKSKTKEEILNRVLPKIHDGANILFHSAGGPTQDLSPTVKALPVIIETLRERGYKLVTVDKLYSLPAYG
ncbi:hypothetical protein JCM16358_24980 [Halanaerocella petrolearia]